MTIAAVMIVVTADGAIGVFDSRNQAADVPVK